MRTDETQLLQHPTTNELFGAGEMRPDWNSGYWGRYGNWGYIPKIESLGITQSCANDKVRAGGTLRSYKLFYWPTEGHSGDGK